MLDSLLTFIIYTLGLIFLGWAVLFLLGLKLPPARVLANLYRRALWAAVRALCRWLWAPAPRRGMGHQAEEPRQEDR